MEDLPYNKQFQIGDHLILSLKQEGVFEGDYVDGGRDRVELMNVLQHNNKNKLGGIQMFYRKEIEDIYTLKPKPCKKVDQKETTNNVCKKIKISEEEYYRYQQMYRNFTYIENADNRYFEAIRKLSESETVGVAAVGMNNSRSSNLNLLVMCTWQHVYIFDLLHKDKRHLYPELKDIFESEFICKVIHKSAALVDILYRWYKVYVQNTFDTQIVDLIIQKNSSDNKCPEVERNISECLVEYLNFPKAVLTDALEVGYRTWLERPIRNQDMIYAAQLVTYLILLKEHMVKELLSPVYKAIDKVQDFVYDCDDYEFSQYMLNKNVCKKVDSLIPLFSKQTISDDKKCDGKNDENSPCSSKDNPKEKVSSKVNGVITNGIMNSSKH